MSPIDIAIICVYVCGIIIGAIGFGIWQYDGELSWWEDVVPFSFLILLWPIILAFALAVGAAFLCLSAITFPMRFLMNVGKKIRVKVSDWRLERKRKKREEEEQKEKDIQDKVKKMQKAMKNGRNRK